MIRVIISCVIVAHVGQQTTGDLPSKADSQGSGSRGQSHVPDLCMHHQHAGDVRDPHRLQRGMRDMDGTDSGSCEPVRLLGREKNMLFGG